MSIDSEQALAIASDLIKEKFGEKAFEKYAPFEATQDDGEWLITTQKIITNKLNMPGVMVITRGGGDPVVVLGPDGQLISASLLR